jgi:predicted NAD/FAD-dependent oxidoreductase
MKIGVIGASLAGLVAGDKLARAGHDVTVIEKDRALGGLLAGHRLGGTVFDYGRPFLEAKNDTFKQFIKALVDKNILHLWTNEVEYYDASNRHKINRSTREVEYYAAEKGMGAVAEYLKRWVDIKSEEQAGGLTHIGANRGRKRSWMINLTDISVFECDAVILAVPAPQAYGVLQTTKDETAALRIIRDIDDIHYQPRYALLASYDRQAPSWKAITCENGALSWIGNETSKSNRQEKANMLMQSSADFVYENRKKSEEEIKTALLEEAAQVEGSWMKRPNDTAMHFWKYYRAVNPLDEYFMELEMDEAPLALVGDYFNGNSAEAAYVSAVKLADYWIEKYKETASVTV